MDHRMIADTVFTKDCLGSACDKDANKKRATYLIFLSVR